MDSILWRLSEVFHQSMDCTGVRDKVSLEITEFHAVPEAPLRSNPTQSAALPASCFAAAFRWRERILGSASIAGVMLFW